MAMANSSCSSSLIPPNKLICSVALYRRLPFPLRLTVWPWALAYAFLSAWAVLWYSSTRNNFQGSPPASTSHPPWGLLVAAPVAGITHALALLFTLWSVRCRCALNYREVREPSSADTVRVTPHPHRGAAALVPLQHDEAAVAERKEGERGQCGSDASGPSLFFRFQERRYTYDPTRGVFEKLPLPTKLPFQEYKQMYGYRTEEDVQEALQRYGRNEFHIPIPGFTELFREHASAPFFVFQMFCVALWCLDEYWYYAIVTGLMLVAFECTVVKQRLRNLKELRGMEAVSTKVLVYRAKKWITVLSTELVPRDVVCLTPSTHGTC
eukprot:RCo035815